MPIIKIPFSEYLAIDAISASDIVNISRTPKDFIKGRSQRNKQTTNMFLGSLVHALILEPHLVDSLYAVEPESLPNGDPIRKAAVDGSMRKTKEGKAFLDEFTAMLGNKTVVSKQVFEEALTMKWAVLNNKAAKALLTDSYNEQIARWKIGDIDCKGQIDAYKAGTLIDLKTTSKIDPEMFEADAYRRRYHQKLAWYKQGLEENGIEIKDVFLITVCYDECIVRHMSDDLIDRGHMFNKRALETYAKCKDSNNWPSWPETLSMGIPGYAMFDSYSE